MTNLRTDMKILVIGGAGHWGTNLSRVFHQLVGRERLILADPAIERWVQERDETKLTYLRRTFAFSGTHYDRLLGEVGACVIATPPKTHYALARACLEAGKHVLVEKPLTLDRKQADELIVLAGLQHRTLLVDDTWWHHSTVRETVNRVVENLANARWPIVSSKFTWRNPREHTSEEGILWTLGPHPVSLMIHLHGDQMPQRVRATIHERSAEMTYYYPGKPGGWSTISLSWNERESRERAFSAWPAPIPSMPIGWSLFGRTPNRVDFRDGKSPKPKEEPLLAMARLFLRQCERPFHDFQDIHAARVVEALAMAEQAARMGQEVTR